MRFLKPLSLLLLPFTLAFFLPQAHAGEEIVFPRVDAPAKKLFVGEKLVYSIRYLGIPVGEAEAHVKELTEVRGREVYHVEIHVKSHPVIDLVYKVRDEHHTFIDKEKLYPLRYEKILSEGRYRADEVMEYDQENHVARYISRKNKSEKEMFIPKEVQDQLSCGYFFRMQEIRPESSVFIPVNADEKNWDLEIKLHGVKSMNLSGVGKFEALEAEPLIKFQGIFVKRGKIRGWISLDGRRIPIKMKVKVPVLGSITAQLIRYEPGAGN